MIAFMKEIIDTLLDWVYNLMPLSPFAPFIQSLEEFPYLAYLNWFFPISEMLVISNAWLVAIFLWYFYGIVLRWLKAIA